MQANEGPRTTTQPSTRIRGFRGIAETGFGRGVVNNISPDQIPDDAVVDALNMEIDRQRNLRTRNGTARLNWHANLIGDICETLDHADWTKTSATVADDVYTGPDSGPADGLLDSSNAALGQASASEAGAGNSQVWSVSAYFRVPFDPLDPPVDWDGNMPAIAIEFTGATPVGGSAVLVPQIGAEHGWALRRGASYPTATSIEIGEVTVDEDDDEYRWIQVLVRGLNNASGNTTAHIRLFPAYAAYTISGADFVYTTNTSGQVVASNTPETTGDGVGVWGAVLERGVPTRRRPQLTGTAATLADNYFTSRITSLFYFKTPASDGIFATSGSDIYKYNATEDFFEPVTGALSLPSDTLCQWVIYDGMAIVANRGTGGNDNPVKIANPGAAPAALGGSPPKARYIKVWNGRVWIVPESEPWTVRCSKLGDAEDWSDTDPSAGSAAFDIGHQEAYDILGMHVHQGMLFFLKRNRIYALVPGSPNTDLGQMEVRQITEGTGSISGYAITTVLEDMVYLSNEGLMAFALTEQFGAFREAALSRDINEFADPEVVVESAVAVKYPRKSQLLVSFRARSAPSNNQGWVADYKLAHEGQIGFTRGSGPLVFTAATLADIDNEERLLLASGPDAVTGLSHVHLYDEEGSFVDEGVRFPVKVRLKAYSWNDLFMVKRFERWETLVELLEGEMDMSFTWRPDLLNSVSKTFTRTLEASTITGARWDQARWDVDRWAAEDVVQNVWAGGKFSGRSGFRAFARAMQLEIAPAGEESGFVLKGFAISALEARDFGRRQSGVGASAGLPNNAMVHDDQVAIASEEGDVGVYEDD